MRNFSVPGMDNECSKKLMSLHQKNLDAFVTANKVVSDGYKAIATKQMKMFQDNLAKMSSLTPEQANEFMQSTLKDSNGQMQELIQMGTNAHKEAFEILSSRAQDLVSEANS